jgi:hypothetical protein
MLCSTVQIAIGALFFLAFIVILKARREDLPEIVRALATWWRRR